MERKSKFKIILYILYVIAIFLTLWLAIVDVLDMNIFSMIYMVLIAGIFLCCCNMFYVPRQLDTQQMLDNKQHMKTDSILWEPLLYLEIPLVLAMLIIYFF